MQRKQLHTALGDVVAGALFRHTNIDDVAESLLAYLEANNLLQNIKNCPYTHSHTKYWCGYDGCRES